MLPAKYDAGAYHTGTCGSTTRIRGIHETFWLIHATFYCQHGTVFTNLSVSFGTCQSFEVAPVASYPLSSLPDFCIASQNLS